jgi:deazaflavin-dependent oxidoreductase (nitroreductase family)
VTAVAYEKPPWFTRTVFNRVAMATGVSGTCALVTPGRRSGEPRRVPVIPVEHEGARYLVSTRGDSDWVRNARSSGTIELQCRRGPSGRFRAVEVPVEQREPIITAYRARAGRTVDAYWRRRPDAVDHPTFRLEPVTA